MKTFFLPLAVMLMLPTFTLFAQETSKDTADSTENLPDPDEFIFVEKVPEFDIAELASRVKYPEEALKNKNGIPPDRVTIQVYVSKEGRALEARAAREDDPFLAEAVIKAIKQITFTPAVQNGAPVGVWMTIPVILHPK